MKKMKINWHKELERFSKSGLSRPEYCRKWGIKNTTFRYHWEKRNKTSKSDFMEISAIEEQSNVFSSCGIFDTQDGSSGKVVHFKVNLWN
ncbi:IS66 family insertion sequence element accessory protein TnpA [Leptospira borgpetersenii]|nr:hypothetical protein [Leptospira borgpetersenii]AXX14637.1 hypothetical protein C4Q31_02735 [Leptospira borgpetersenii serovar Ceylonica]EMO12007.1 hypothetical protein LEP1GSC137_0902 [Leptospira borgpetersenii str. Noumea 25]ALO26261.1 hypothetical protein LBBP_01986 [Leptospira borgpetersenii serovar Ballum]EMN56867.1 hypothetical protein LEP1GSC090_1146 [Leptospira borgpetersenii serovar Javanica str. MK146]EPG58170.1 hypothetical protein LEP1GSC103_3105 [Leptospira borgpetersenii serov